MDKLFYFDTIIIRQSCAIPNKFITKNVNIITNFTEIMLQKQISGQ